MTVIHAKFLIYLLIGTVAAILSIHIFAPAPIPRVLTPRQKAAIHSMTTVIPDADTTIK
jgi:hypothetical protein